MSLFSQQTILSRCVVTTSVCCTISVHATHKTHTVTTEPHPHEASVLCAALKECKVAHWPFTGRQSNVPLLMDQGEMTDGSQMIKKWRLLTLFSQSSIVMLYRDPFCQRLKTHCAFMAMTIKGQVLQWILAVICFQCLFSSFPWFQG